MLKYSNKQNISNYDITKQQAKGFGLVINVIKLNSTIKREPKNKQKYNYKEGGERTQNALKNQNLKTIQKPAII